MKKRWRERKRDREGGNAELEKENGRKSASLSSVSLLSSMIRTPAEKHEEKQKYRQGWVRLILRFNYFLN